MLYKFKSKSTGDVIMLQANGRRVLEIIGKGKGPEGIDKGIILPEEMTAAIAALEAAIAKEEAEQQSAIAAALDANREPPHSETISLRQRALPFIQMLRRCQRAGHEVFWGV